MLLLLLLLLPLRILLSLLLLLSARSIFDATMECWILVFSVHTQCTQSECGNEERQRRMEANKRITVLLDVTCVWGEQLTQPQQVAECLKVSIDVKLAQRHKTIN